MKTLSLLIITLLTCTVYSQTSVKLPGEAGKSYKIEGEYMGEMIRSTGGEDKKKEHYYAVKKGEALIITKHVIEIATNQTELLTITTLDISEIDWDYFASSNGEGPVEKKVAGKLYYVFSINAVRGKRFKQVKYTNATPNDVSVGNVDIQINSKEEADKFFKLIKQ